MFFLLWKTPIGKEVMPEKSFKDSIKNLLTPSEQAQIAESLHSFTIISGTDSRGVINYVNDRFCEISGYSREELLGKTHHLVNSGFHSKEFFLNMWTTIRSGKVWHGEIQNRKKDGDTYWVSSYIVPIFDEQGKAQRFISFRTDITQQKLEHAELEAERIRSIHLGRLTSIGEMASNVAHEINNPLTVISGSLDMIRASLGRLKEIPDTTEFGRTQLQSNVERAERALKQVDRITKIIHGLKRFSRHDETTEKQEVSICDIYRSVSELCSERLRKNQVQLRIQPTELSLECNSIQIEQVLVNLISNAIDELKTHTERWIEISTRQKEKTVEISVTDSGSGIPPEIAKRLTEPFFTTKIPGHGTGLGLSITRTIIQQHGGNFYYDPSSANTRFVIALPISQHLPSSTKSAA